MRHRTLSSLTTAALLAVSAQTEARAQITGLGLNLDLYTSYFGSEHLLDMSAHTPATNFVFTGVIDYPSNYNPLIPFLTASSTSFGVVWKGYVFFEDGKSYSFATQSDDASYVYIDFDLDGVFNSTNERVVNNGGSHGMQVRGGVCVAPATRYFPVIITHHQNTGGYGMVARWCEGALSFPNNGNTFPTGLNPLNASATRTAGGQVIPVFSTTGVLPGENNFTKSVRFDVDNGTLRAGSEIQSVSQDASVSFAWGGQDGVFTATNSVPVSVDGPVWVPVTESAHGTWFYTVFSGSNGVFSATASNTEPGFHIGPVTLAKSGDLFEAGKIPATVTVSRATSCAAPLRVWLAFGGDAEPGVDYETPPAFVLIPPGATSANFALKPLPNFDKQHDTLITVALAPGAYNVSPAPTVSLAIFNEPAPTDPDVNLWLGSGNASTAANWLKKRAPLATDKILLNATSTGNMTWDYPAGGLPASVTSWTQEADYTGIVTFPTTVEGEVRQANNNALVGDGAFPRFTVTNDMVVLGGVIRGTPQVNMTGGAIQGNAPLFTRRLSLNVGGDLVVGAQAVVHVDECGWRHGPGLGSGASAAHGGGSGKNSSNTISTNTYGSVFQPVLPGSSGGTDNNRMGGGVIRLDVSGDLVVDGKISSQGQSTKWGPGTGGSILVHARSVKGSGVISANGGTGIVAGETMDGAGGGGGRVAVYTDESVALPSSSITALGGYYWGTPVGNSNTQNPLRAGTQGSVYLALKSTPFAGTLRMNNENISAEGRRSHLPGVVAQFNGGAANGVATVTPAEDFSRVDLLLEKRGHVQLVRDVFFNSVRLGVSANNDLVLALGGNTLTAREMFVFGQRVRSGTHVKTAGAANPELPGVPLADWGTVVILPKSTLLMLR